MRYAAMDLLSLRKQRDRPDITHQTTIRFGKPRFKLNCLWPVNRAVAARRDRVSREAGRRQSAPPVLKGPTGGLMMTKDAFDRWWEWAENRRITR